MGVKAPSLFPLDYRPILYDDAAPLHPTVESGTRWYRDVQYAMIPGYRPLLDLSVPDSAAPPLVVIIHGGAWLQGSHKPMSGDFTDYTLLWPRLLDAGLAVASIQYRHSKEALFPAQVNDAKAAVRWLRAASATLGYDATRIGTVGDSSGGHLSLLLGTNTADPTLEGTVGLSGPSSSVTAAVSWFGHTRLDTMHLESTPGHFHSHDPADSPESLLIGATIADHPDLARAASPIAYMSTAGAPTLLIHGRSDRLVPHQQSVAYHEALQSLGVRSHLHLVDGADHCFFGADFDSVIATTVPFLSDELTPGASASTPDAASVRI